MKYFSTAYAIDERIINIIEDSILCNPSLTDDDKQLLILTLCYSLPYEEKDPHKSRITLHKLDKKYISPIEHFKPV